MAFTFNGQTGRNFKYDKTFGKIAGQTWLYYLNENQIVDVGPTPVFKHESGEYVYYIKNPDAGPFEPKMPPPPEPRPIMPPPPLSRPRMPPPPKDSAEKEKKEAEKREKKEAEKAKKAEEKRIEEEKKKNENKFLRVLKLICCKSCCNCCCNKCCNKCACCKSKPNNVQPVAEILPEDDLII
jgi:type IV secretory pathway VirB10-like protein